jgi:hypothetical protein
MPDDQKRDSATLIAEALQACEVAVRHVVGIAEETADAGNQSVITHGDRTLVVLENGLPLETIVRQVRGAQQARPGMQAATVVLTRSVLAYLVRHYNPYDYFDLPQGWTVTDGKDPLAEIAPPVREDFVRYLWWRLAHLLMFPRSDEVFSTPLTMPRFEKELDRAMAVRLLLRDDWISPHRQDTADRWHTAFPECLLALDAIKAHIGETQQPASRQMCLELFRSIVRDVRRCVDAGGLTPNASTAPVVQQ